VRRAVATLLVVASPVLLAVPAGAAGPRTAGPAVTPAPAIPAVMATPVAVAPPAVPVVALTPAIPAVRALASIRPVIRAVRARAAAAPTAAVGDAAYEARLQAELCAARQIFCGLDRNGRYPGR
jgi:hypothetical protein